jgi:hypothetical protein
MRLSDPRRQLDRHVDGREGRAMGLTESWAADYRLFSSESWIPLVSGISLTVLWYRKNC